MAKRARFHCRCGKCTIKSFTEEPMLQHINGMHKIPRGNIEFERHYIDDEGLAVLQAKKEQEDEATVDSFIRQLDSLRGVEDFLVDAGA